MTKRPFRGFYSNDGHRYEYVKGNLYKVDGKLKELDEDPFNPTANDCLRMAIEHEPGSEAWHAFIRYALERFPKKRGRPKKDSLTDLDELCLSAMRLTEGITGEKGPYALAKATLALERKTSPETYKLLKKGSSETSTIERMARLWTKWGSGKSSSPK